MKKIFIITGEHSGDLHASFVVKELLKLNSNVQIEAVGGTNLQEAGAKLFCGHKDMAVVGISLKAVINHINIGKKILEYLKNDYKPDLVLLVDYGGFNLKMAKFLKAANIPAFYYISPQFWASRKSRIKSVRKYIEKMMVIFPFEELFHKKEKVNAEYVGHPLISQLPKNFDKSEFCRFNNLKEDKQIVGIFPGSRKMELNYLLPIFLQTAKELHLKDKNIQFCIGQAPNIDDETFEKFLSKVNQDGLDFTILKNQNHALIACSDVVLLASGSISLETAIYKTPMVISYKGPTWAYLIYLLVRYLKCISIPNIIAGKEVVKEFLQFNAKPDLIADEIYGLLNDKEKRAKMISDLEEINTKFGDKIASKEVSKIINDYLNTLDKGEK